MHGGIPSPPERIEVKKNRQQIDRRAMIKVEKPDGTTLARQNIWRDR
jgi:hypothetical protein